MNPPCRCLLSETAGEEALYATLRDYIDTLPQEQKASDALYRARLAVCAACAHLQSGMCARCGCYVEVRAMKRRLACPDVPPRWPAEP